MKKTFTIFLFLIIMLSNYCLADEIDNEEISIDNIKQEILETSATISNEPKINSRAAIVIERKTKKILFEKNANEKRAMASTTKIMTAIIALENSKLDQEIIVSKKAANTGGSRLELHTGDKITMIDLIYGLMLRSGNDAAVQIAETIGGNEEEFGILMNKKAKELGLTNTNFVTPHGLDNINHYTTAYELAILTDYALNNPKFAQIVSTKTKTILINGMQRELYNTNELLGNLIGINGVKTGFTNNAGRCLVCSCDRNNANLISVVLGADTKKDRTKDSVQILEYCYSNYEMANLEEILNFEFKNWYEKNESKFIVNKGESSNVELTLSNIEFKEYPIKKNEYDNINIEIKCDFEIEAPINVGDAAGEIKVLYNNEVIESVKILQAKEIRKRDIGMYFRMFFERYNKLQVNLQFNK